MNRHPFINDQAKEHNKVDSNTYELEEMEDNLGSFPYVYIMYIKCVCFICCVWNALM